MTFVVGLVGTVGIGAVSSIAALVVVDATAVGMEDWALSDVSSVLGSIAAGDWISLADRCARFAIAATLSIGALSTTALLVVAATAPGTDTSISSGLAPPFAPAGVGDRLSAILTGSCAASLALASFPTGASEP